MASKQTLSCAIAAILDGCTAAAFAAPASETSGVIGEGLQEITVTPNRDSGANGRDFAAFEH